MNAFRTLLIVMFVGIVAYTLIVGVTQGWNLIPVFFGDLAAMTWPGQFNFDFTCFLVLSGLWIAWRHQFSPGGVALGLIATVGGILVVAPYLLLATFQASGDMPVLLLGQKRTKA
ncbi:MAG: hypothetical protein O2890_03945 [Cyanobacteria bacterium]|nr:hypothetical protein [Cyanobacteriota bacterium]MDA0865562.1 hypothetical protein [Cyanobacteriota bacterium]